jgi:biopolymer transport protein ExbB
MTFVQSLVPVLLAHPAPATSGSFVSTALEMVVKGGWVMIPLGLCSLAAVTLIVERLIVTRTTRVAPPALLTTVRGLKHNPRQALAACTTDPSPLARVLEAAIKARRDSRETRDKLVTEAGERQVHKLRRRMRVMSALPQAATMLGLLGTVVGMIRTFTVVAASAESLGKTERLAQGIYEAWTATAAGLAIAIPSLIMYHIILSRIDAAAAALDAAAQSFEEGQAEPATQDAPAPTAELAVAEA